MRLFGQGRQAGNRSRDNEWFLEPYGWRCQTAAGLYRGKTGLYRLRRGMRRKLDDDTELTGFGQTIAQAAAGQAVQALCATARIVLALVLQFGLAV